MVTPVKRIHCLFGNLYHGATYFMEVHCSSEVCKQSSCGVFVSHRKVELLKTWRRLRGVALTWGGRLGHSPYVQLLFLEMLASAQAKVGLWAEEKQGPQRSQPTAKNSSHCLYVLLTLLTLLTSLTLLTLLTSLTSLTSLTFLMCCVPLPLQHLHHLETAPEPQSGRLVSWQLRRKQLWGRWMA
ncbi:hypothetical protein GH733_005708 [Mirounga leonina]|nr:hypothetical protein GH733_005708 [Mirounga leonina]